MQIFAKVGFPLKARATGSAGKLTDQHGEAVNDGRTGVIRQEAIADQAPDALFDRPQMGSLPHKGAAIQREQARKEVIPGNIQHLSSSLS